MIDPISLLATQGASRIVDRLLNAASPAAPTSTVEPLDQPNKSSQLTQLQESLTKDLQKFLDLNPEIKTQLGEGPYQLKIDGNSITLSGSTGNDITLSSNSHFGQKALLLSEWNNSKFFQKGLELKAI